MYIKHVKKSKSRSSNTNIFKISWLKILWRILDLDLKQYKEHNLTLQEHPDPDLTVKKKADPDPT